jgi:hypothetical protein
MASGRDERRVTNRAYKPREDTRVLEERLVGYRIAFRRLPDPNVVRISSTIHHNDAAISQHMDWNVETVRKFCESILELITPKEEEESGSHT